ncbi:MAG: tubulin/FtsZ family protein [Candidatus Geothermarchaeales archaeon]
MRVAVIGLGQAGGRIADLFAYYAQFVDKDVTPTVMAVNTARADLVGLRVLPDRQRILIGQTILKGHGVGLDIDLGAQVMEQEMRKIKFALAEAGTSKVDAFLLVAGLGGGTGSGSIPVVASCLKDYYTEPVYAIAVLPTEEEGGLMAKNAARSIMALSETTDGIIIFDNNIWANPALPLKENYKSMNEQLVKPFLYILGPGEIDSSKKVSGKVVDSSDIIKTLEGFSVISYAEEHIPMGERVKKTVNFFNRHSPKYQLDRVTRSYTVVQNAVHGKLSCECNVKSAKKALIVLAGPPHDLCIEGVMEASRWLESYIPYCEVRGGDYPLKGSTKITGVVLLSDLQDIPRIEGLLTRAVDFQEAENTREKAFLSAGAKLQPLKMPTKQAIDDTG